MKKILIEIKDLVIGHHYMYDYKPCEYIGVEDGNDMDDGFLTFLFKDLLTKQNYFSIDGEDIEGIRLSSEVLGKITELERVDAGHLSWSFKDGLFFPIFVVGQYYSFNGLGLYSRFLYLHELENAYYFITKKTLTFKP